MAKKIVMIILIAITFVIIIDKNLTIEQKIGRNQEYVIGFEKRDISDLQRSAIQEGFEYIEQDPGYQFKNNLFKDFDKTNSICSMYKESNIYDGSPYKISYLCLGDDVFYVYVYDYKTKTWYTHENYSEDEQDYYFEDYKHIDIPSDSQEVFDSEFKEIHENILNGVKELEGNSD